MKTNFSVPAKRNPVLGMLRILIVFTLFQFIHFDGFGIYKSYHFDVIHNRLILKIEMKGDTFNFAFDSGSNTSIIDSAFARELELPFTSSTSIPTLGGRLNGYFTTDSSFNIVPQMIWRIAPLSFDMDSINLQIHGIIGASRIINQHLVDVNFKTKILTIGPEIEFKNFIEMDLINPLRKEQLIMAKYLPQYPTILTSIRIGDQFFQNIKLIIDTGCKYEIAIVAKDSSMIKSFESEKKNYKSLNNRSISIVFSEVQLLDKNLKNIKTISPLFYAGKGSDEDLIGLLGLPYLKRYNRVIFNYPEMKIYFEDAVF